MQPLQLLQIEKCYFYYLSVRLQWNRVYYYCDNILAYCYQPWMTDGDVCGAISGMNEWQGKPAPMPLRPLQIPYDLARAAAVSGRRLTAWATARPG
jgi:hypothetical protein